LHENLIPTSAQQFCPFAATEVDMPLRTIFAISNILMLLIGSTTTLGNQGFAQLEEKNSSQSDFTIRTQVALVTLDAVVRNSKAGFVGDLQQSDFEIYDEGVAQKIASFSHEYRPLDIALIVDSSGSEQKYRSRLRDAARDVLQTLNPKEDRVALFCFGIFPIQVTGLTLDRALIISSIDRIPETTEGSNITDALWDATQYLARQPKGHRRAIIMISDNMEHAAPLSTNADVRSGEYNRSLTEEMLESDVTLVSIKTPGEEGKNFVSRMNVFQIAVDTGGEVLDTNSLDTLSYALNSAVLHIKNSYVIGFYPSDERNQGSYHNLKVMLDKDKCSACKVWTRKGYYAGGQAIAATNIKEGTRESTPLQPKKYSLPPAPYFGLLLLLSSDSPQILLMNEEWTKNTKQKAQFTFTPDDFAMLTPNIGGKKKHRPMIQTDLDNKSIFGLAPYIENIPITSSCVSHRYLTGLKMLWTDPNQGAVSRLFKFLFENSPKPHFSDFRKRLNFQILANKLSEVENKQIIRMDLKCDAKQLFFFFDGERYNTWLVLSSKYVKKSKSDLIMQFYESSYSEEEFVQILESGIPLSFTIEIPKSESKIRLMVFNPIMSIYDIKEVEVQR
jgi:Ca-activated chloride channel homolog